MTTLELPTRFRVLNRNSISVAEYHALGEDCTLTPKDKVVLIRGRLVQKVSKNAAHNRTLRRLKRLFPKFLDTFWEVASKESITFPDSEPEPDLAVVRATAPGAEDKNETPTDCGLIVEVADSSLRDDRTEMLELYAEAGIPVYWIVNIPDRQIEVYREPTAEGQYGQRTIYRDGDSVSVVLDGQEVGTLAVSAILPLEKSD